jgi:uncharacterized protein
MTNQSSGGSGMAFAKGYPRPLLLGMIHLAPLPGSPRFKGDLGAVARAASRDLKALIDGGADGMIIENLGDVPYYPDRVPPITVAAMTAVAGDLMNLLPKRFLVGINALRNDAAASLSIAVAVGASFIRVNVHTDAAIADQGILEGKAHETIRLRSSLNARVAVLADVAVKHASPLHDRAIDEQARDAVGRGLADGILVTGPHSGAPVERDRLVAVRRAIPGVPLLVASGVTPDSAPALARYCDGFIVGTWIKRAGEIDAPVDVRRVKRLAQVIRRIRASADGSGNATKRA